MIEENKTVFAKDKYDIGNLNEYEARIDFLVDIYCCKRPIDKCMGDRVEIENQLFKLLVNKLFEESY